MNDNDPLEGFAKRLHAGQQPLGREAEKVLHDNLWELYVKDFTRVCDQTGMSEKLRKE